ncbi:MAG: histidine phosphatase family protein [Pseudomonadota bacterium]
MITPAHPFYLIRHGETDWNREQRFQGRTDIPLNEKGRGQASAYSTLLLAEGHDWTRWHFVSSPLIRARHTMELLRDALGLDPKAYDVEDALIEVTFGDWERQTLTELRRKEPELMAAREADKWNFVPPNGESYDQARGRTRFVLESLPGPTVVVSHGGVIRAARYGLEALDPKIAADTKIPQDDIYAWRDGRGGWLRDTTTGGF